MTSFFEKPSFPPYLKRREDFERLRDYQGDDNSMEIFPHLNLNWWQIKKAFKESGKPIADLGASFSTLPVEGELQGVKIYPVDIMHMQGRKRYEHILSMRMFNARMCNAYTGRLLGFDKYGNERRMTKNPIKGMEYDRKVYDGIEKAKANYIVADLSKIPLADGFFSITIAHDSLPKHSKDWDAFITEQLPEILRVTNSTAYVFPMGIYKTEDRDLVEQDALFNNSDALKRIQNVAASHGFTFKLEKASYRSTSGAGRDEEEDDARSGVFERIRTQHA
jgi:hypothetical protein